MGTGTYSRVNRKGSSLRLAGRGSRKLGLDMLGLNGTPQIRSAEIAAGSCRDYERFMIDTSLLLFLLCAGSTGPRVVENDYEVARAAAMAQKKVLFVEAWAPWCHSCVYMREHVLTRPTFKAFESDLVFLAVNTELRRSAEFLAKFPVDAWPTLYFIEPVSERVLFKWLGTADEDQLKSLLAAARVNLQKAPDEDAVQTPLSLLASLALAGKSEMCAQKATEQLAAPTSSAERVNAISWGLGCALKLPPSEHRTKLVAHFCLEAQKALLLEGILADDRSGLFESLVEARLQDNAEGEARALAERWLSFLESEAAKAQTPAARAAFDAHRVSAALAAQQPARSLDALALSELQAPRDYNPPARLALLYQGLHRSDDAVAAIDRALAKCTEGPRKLRLFIIKADLHRERSEPGAQKAVLLEALAYAKKLPKSQRPEARMTAIEQALATLKE